MSQVITSTSAVQDVNLYQHPNHHFQPSGFLIPCLPPTSRAFILCIPNTGFNPQHHLGRAQSTITSEKQSRYIYRIKTLKNNSIYNSIERRNRKDNLELKRKIHNTESKLTFKKEER
jgi:hypothetical protein